MTNDDNIEPQQKEIPQEFKYKKYEPVLNNDKPKWLIVEKKARFTGNAKTQTAIKANGANRNGSGRIQTSRNIAVRDAEN